VTSQQGKIAVKEAARQYLTDLTGKHFTFGRSEFGDSTPAKAAHKKPNCHKCIAKIRSTLQLETEGWVSG
jgi:hypothetical protein